MSSYSNWESYFPELDPEDIHARVATMWDFSWAYPLPKRPPMCGCGRREWHARTWGFTDRRRGEAGLRVKWRCNVSLKCAWCGEVRTWGVPVRDEYAAERLSWTELPNVQWREALRVAEARGFSPTPGA